MDNLYKGDYKFIGIKHLIHILDNPLFNGFRCAVLRGYGFNTAVPVIAYIIKRGNINPLNFRGGTEELLLTSALCFKFLVKVDNL